ncbi:hypothetical protein [Microbacterium sp. NPDC091662]|uniref:hypothetical protein n=1 Tax=Microbacterium sp. NPDC091662 TaxID=3364211 RepID=UPI00382DECF4
MPWFKVDDGFHGHPKVMMLSPSAIGLWLLAGTWSAQYLTDGLVPAGMVRRFGGTPEDAADLVNAALWHEADGGYQFHEWAEYQPLKSDVEAERAASRERMRAMRAKRKGVAAEVVQENADDGAGAVRQNVGERSGDVRANKSERADVVLSESDGRSVEVRSTPTQPDPTQPEVPKGTSGGPRSRGTRIPEPFLVTPAMREWAADRTPLVNVDSSTERFVNHWRAKAGKDATKRDWPATWRNWLLRDQDDRQNRGGLTPTERAMQTVAAGRELFGRPVTSLELEDGAA